MGLLSSFISKLNKVTTTLNRVQGLGRSVSSQLNAISRGVSGSPRVVKPVVLKKR